MYVSGVCLRERFFPRTRETERVCIYGMPTRDSLWKFKTIINSEPRLYCVATFACFGMRTREEEEDYYYCASLTLITAVFTRSLPRNSRAVAFYFYFSRDGSGANKTTGIMSTVLITVMASLVINLKLLQSEA